MRIRPTLKKPKIGRLQCVDVIENYLCKNETVQIFEGFDWIDYLVQFEEHKNNSTQVFQKQCEINFVDLIVSKLDNEIVACPDVTKTEKYNKHLKKANKILLGKLHDDQVPTCKGSSINPVATFIK